MSWSSRLADLEAYPSLAYVFDKFREEGIDPYHQSLWLQAQLDMLDGLAPCVAIWSDPARVEGVAASYAESGDPADWMRRHRIYPNRGDAEAGP